MKKTFIILFVAVIFTLLFWGCLYFGRHDKYSVDNLRYIYSSDERAYQDIIKALTLKLNELQK